jgi:hypothetical protein
MILSARFAPAGKIRRPRAHLARQAEVPGKEITAVQVQYLIVATDVTDGPEGTVNIYEGDFDTLWATGFPAAVPRLVLLCRLILAATECDYPHTLRIELLGPDGEQLLALAPHTFVQARHPTEPYRPVRHRVRCTFAPVQFPAPGDYGFHLLVDNHELANLPFYVRTMSVPRS